MLGLLSPQIGFTQAFPNADIDDNTYIAIPQGCFYDAATNHLQQNKDQLFETINIA
jgi:hypothetical protein